jgi:hypothetical protein
MLLRGLQKTIKFAAPADFRDLRIRVQQEMKTLCGCPREFHLHVFVPTGYVINSDYQYRQVRDVAFEKKKDVVLFVEEVETQMVSIQWAPIHKWYFLGSPALERIANQMHADRCKPEPPEIAWTPRPFYPANLMGISQINAFALFGAVAVFAQPSAWRLCLTSMVETAAKEQHAQHLLEEDALRRAKEAAKVAVRGWGADLQCCAYMYPTGRSPADGCDPFQGMLTKRALVLNYGQRNNLLKDALGKMVDIYRSKPKLNSGGNVIRRVASAAF